jgi:addiction module RelE/StbE family toxin
MQYQLSEQFRKKYKKQDVRIKKAIVEALQKFSKNPFDLSLRNHVLKRDLKGFRSIDITVDYRAIYEEISEEDSIFAYFENFGTHKELFQ